MEHQRNTDNTALLLPIGWAKSISDDGLRAVTSESDFARGTWQLRYYERACIGGPTKYQGRSVSNSQENKYALDWLEGRV